MAKSEAVQYLEKRLAQARQQITPLKQADTLLSESTDVVDAAAAARGAVGSDAGEEEVGCDEDRRSGEHVVQVQGQEAAKTPVKDAVPFARCCCVLFLRLCVHAGAVCVVGQSRGCVLQAGGCLKLLGRCAWCSLSLLINLAPSLFRMLAYSYQ